MSQTLNLKIKGLYTLPSELSEVPEGALSEAKNINIDAESVATARRGFDRYSYALSGGSDRFNKMFEYKDTVIGHYNTNKMTRDTGAAWSDYSGTFAPPDSSTKVRATKANQNLYFTTSDGVKKLSAISGTPAQSGVVRALTMEISATGATGYLADSGTGNAVYYRHAWGLKDANNNLVLGAPSQLTLFSISTGGGTSRDASIVVTIPSSITTSHILQIYRSEPTGSSSVEPEDELRLVYEASPTAGEITAKSMTVTESTPTTLLLGAALYTNATQEGILQANDEPPFCKDITEFKGSLFFSNTQSKHRLTVTLLAVSDGAGSPATALQLNDTIVIDGVTYTAKAATTVASNEFQKYTAGTPTQNIRDTALALCKVINQSTSNTTVYAYYLSGAADLPGKILLESRTFSGAQFAVTGNHATPWNPQLPSSGTTLSSTNDQFKNATFISKFQQPEHVPLLNVFRSGSADHEILRSLPLKSTVFLLKEDGLYAITGESTANFRTDIFDSTVRIKAPESAVVLNNAIYCLSDQGVVEITETGASVISRPIEDSIKEVLAYGTPAAGQGLEAVYGMAYETDRKYVLAVPSSAANNFCDTYYVYNTFTRTWTKWDGYSSKHSFVNPADDKIYVSRSDTNYPYKERKTNTFADHADYLTAVTISAMSGDGLTATLSSTAGIQIGDVLYQSNSVYSIITAVGASTVTLAYDGNLTAAAATVYSAIDSQMQWVPITGGNPGILKHFREIALLFKRRFFIECKAVFSSDSQAGTSTITFSGVGTGQWGLFPWGTLPWGGALGKKPERTYVPRDKQRCTQLNVKFTSRIGFSRFQLNGLSVMFNALNERFSR